MHFSTPWFAIGSLVSWIILVALEYTLLGEWTVAHLIGWAFVALTFGGLLGVAGGQKSGH